MAEPLTLEEKRARIEQLRADVELKLLDQIKRSQDIVYEPWKIAIGGITAGAALMGAAVALVKVLGT